MFIATFKAVKYSEEKENMVKLSACKFDYTR
jgi:hypothetical protein